LNNKQKNSVREKLRSRDVVNKGRVVHQLPVPSQSQSQIEKDGTGLVYNVLPLVHIAFTREGSSQ
jgi:hypothetical protein